MKIQKLFIVTLSFFIPLLSFAERTIIVKGLYLNHDGPNPGPTGLTTVRIQCAIVSEATCYVVTDQLDMPSKEGYYLSNEDFEPNESIVIRLNDGTEFSGQFKNYSNEPANPNNNLERNHIFTIQ